VAERKFQPPLELANAAASAVQVRIAISLRATAVQICTARSLIALVPWLIRSTLDVRKPRSTSRNAV